MGVEKNQYLALVDFANGQTIRSFAGPSSRQTANQRLMALALRYIQGDNQSRSDILFISREQTKNKLRCGLGVVHGKIEGFCLDHHGQYHLLATLSIVKHSLAINDTPVYVFWTEVLSGWLNLYSSFSSPNGQVALPGWRAWPYRANLQSLLSPDGWHHGPINGTLSVAADTVHRLYTDLPQIDNKGKDRGVEWMMKNRSDEPSWQPAILLNKLLSSEKGFKRDLDKQVEKGTYCYPVGLDKKNLDHNSGYLSLMTQEPKSVAPRAWGPVSAVKMEWEKVKGRYQNRVSWYPNTIPPTSRL